MEPRFEYFLVFSAVLLVLSVIASKFSDRFGVPVLLIFLIMGMLAGSEGPGGIYFNDPALAQNIGIISLVVILFSGGLDTHWEEIRLVLKEGLALATVGVLITTFVLGYFAHLILNISILQGLLLGAIVSSTDAAAVFSILGSSGIQLKRPLSPLLEFESGSNDPMAVFLTVGIIDLILDPSKSPLSLAPAFLQQMILGAAVGFLGGRLLLFLIHRLDLRNDGLYPVMAIGVAFLIFGATTLLGGSGFLAVYLAGIITGRKEFLHKRGLLRFFDGLAWLSQILMFLTLGLLVFPSQLVPIILPGLVLAVILILVARPLSVGISLLFSKIKLAEKVFISWVGLRGAVPIILATYPRLAGIEESGLMFNIVFFVVLTSVLVQGASIPTVAQWLWVKEPPEPRSRNGLDPDLAWNEIMLETAVPVDSWVVGKTIAQLNLPDEYLITLIKRGEKYIIPNGSTLLQPLDHILGVSRPEIHQEIEGLLNKTVTKHENR